MTLSTVTKQGVCFQEEGVWTKIGNSQLAESSPSLSNAVRPADPLQSDKSKMPPDPIDKNQSQMPPDDFGKSQSKMPEDPLEKGRLSMPDDPFGKEKAPPGLKSSDLKKAP